MAVSLGSPHAGRNLSLCTVDLAISVRTYRRYVTGILELLEANSRFQAGVRATELGILGNTSA